VQRANYTGGSKEDCKSGCTGKGFTNGQVSMQAYLKQLLNLRKNNPVIAEGKTLHFAPFNGVYVYFRYTDDKMVMVVMNKNEADTVIDTRRFAEILGNKWKAENVMTAEVIADISSLKVKGKTTSVFNIN